MLDPARAACGLKIRADSDNYKTFYLLIFMIVNANAKTVHDYPYAVILYCFDDGSWPFNGSAWSCKGGLFHAAHLCEIIKAV